MKILIIQTSFIGDTILSTSVISGLKKIYPEAALTLMTTPVSAQLFTHDRYLEAVIQFDKRGKEKGWYGLLKKAAQIRKLGFDKVFSLHRSLRTSLIVFLSRIPERIGFSDATLPFFYTKKIHRPGGGHAVYKNHAIIGWNPSIKNIEPELRLSAPPHHALSDATLVVLKRTQYRPFAVLAPGSAWKTKQWHINGFIETARYLKDKGIDIVLIGGKADQTICRDIQTALKVSVSDLSGKIPLSDTMYLVKNAAIVICNDSMALHMASALKTPTVAVFCATSPTFGFGPFNNPEASVVEDGPLDCKPCRRHGSMLCPNRTQQCMKLPADHVINAIRQLLQRKT